MDDHHLIREPVINKVFVQPFMQCLITERMAMTITQPTVAADAYSAALDPDQEDATPKVGTTVQSGMSALEALLKPESSNEYPTDFKFAPEAQLVKFLGDEPFAVYEQHWIERPKGRKSFVCNANSESGCPLCDILGDKPRGKFAWNVLVLSGDTQTVQVFTAPPVLARQIVAAHKDERKGPLSKEFWEVSRIGMGPTTQYSLNYVRGRDLAEEWKLDLDQVNALVANAVPYTAAQVVRESPRSELLEVARSVE